MKVKLLMLWLVVQVQVLPAHAYQTATSPPDSTRKAPENWFNLDQTENQVTGVSTEKAYQLLKDKPSKTVVVGVIDSGIDINHEDLKDVIWVNEDETPGNGVDDDKNGYVDDVHGWNFIGGKDGKHVNQDTYELTREYVRLSDKFKDKKKIRRKERDEYAYYQQIKADFEQKVEALKKQKADFDQTLQVIDIAKKIMRENLGKEEITAEDVQAVESSNEMVQEAKRILSIYFENEEGFKGNEEYFKKALEYGYNTEFNPRVIVGDDYNDLSERNYGNNDVFGPHAEHGTHVAGIIAANRKNEIGMEGVADNVKIMVVRTVPDGDERDKDVANAIRYAADNGAQVINMSFGKDYSPNKKAVDEAVEYAASKGVLLVHAAGNDGKNVDIEENFPTRKLDPKHEAANWLEVGASSWKDSTGLAAEFSNYGKQTVDVFAPGVDVYSTAPGQQYKDNSGTSMAAPVTSGVAALLFSYFPTLTAAQVRDIIVKSTVKMLDLPVTKPGAEDDDDTIKFGELSISGGVINAYEAVKMAESLSAQNQPK